MCRYALCVAIKTSLLICLKHSYQLFVSCYSHWIIQAKWNTIYGKTFEWENLSLSCNFSCELFKVTLQSLVFSIDNINLQACYCKNFPVNKSSRKKFLLESFAGPMHTVMFKGLIFHWWQFIEFSFHNFILEVCLYPSLGMNPNKEN